MYHSVARWQLRRVVSDEKVHIISAVERIYSCWLLVADMKFSWPRIAG